METSDNGLPAGVVDAVLNRGDLARALNKSEPTITAWIAEGMPVIREGKNGQPYELQLSACWSWLKARERVEAERTTAAEAAVQQMRLALVGGDDLGGGDRSLSPKERQAEYDAEKSFMLAALQRAALVKQTDIVGVLEDVFLTVRDGVTALPDRLEREAGITGKALDLAIKICDTILSETEDRVRVAAGGRAYREAAE